MIIHPHRHRRLHTSRLTTAGLLLLATACLLYIHGHVSSTPRTPAGRRALTTRAHHAPPPPHLHHQRPVHPSLLTKPILQPRRNHGCAFLGDTMVLVGGRYASSVEVWDTATGAQAMMTANHSMLDVNHFQLTVVDGSELWIPCGFQGSNLDRERHMDATLIIDPAQGYAITTGPRLDQPRGGCGALALDVDGPARPQHVCVFGGSIGSHDKGNFTSTVSCYDRGRQRWHRPLPALPIPADHVNVVHLPAGTDCGGGGDGGDGSGRGNRRTKPVIAQPERVVYLNFRNKSYTTARPEVFALDIVREAGSGAVDVAATAAGGWYLTGMSAPDPDLTRDAAGVAVSPTGRFIFTFGGIHYPKIRENYVVFKDIIAIDMCTGTSVVLSEDVDMRIDRFAVVTCQTAAGWAVTCGGTSKTPGNMASCDVHSLHALEQLAVQMVEGAR